MLKSRDLDALLGSTGETMVALISMYGCAPCDALKVAIEQDTTSPKIDVFYCRLRPSAARHLAATSLIRGYPAIAIVRNGIILAAMTGLPAGTPNEICGVVKDFVAKIGDESLDSPPSA